MAKFQTAEESLAVLKEWASQPGVVESYFGELPISLFKSADGKLMAEFKDGRIIPWRESVMPVVLKVIEEFHCD